jgi:hypothetical protein
MVIARRPDAVAFPTLPRQTAHFASAKGFQLSGFNPLQDGVRPVTDVEPQAAKMIREVLPSEATKSTSASMGDSFFLLFPYTF